MVEEMPQYYKELYGDCANSVFKKEQIHDKIKNAHAKSNLWGRIVEGYYKTFHGYRSEEEIMKGVFESIKPSLIRTIEEIESSKL